MSESDFSQLSEADFPPQEAQRPQRRVSRRHLFKRAAAFAAGAAATATMGRGLQGFAEDVGVLRRGGQNEGPPQGNATSGTPEEIPYNENLEIKEIEERLGIRLINLLDAYKIMGMEFDEKNTKEFGDVLPLRWDLERAKMVEEFFGYLPEFFHEPDGKGNPLMITLTNFGTHPAAADYFMGQSNFMRIDMDAFTSENKPGGLDLLTHESTHHLQDLGYSKLQQQLPKMFGKDTKQFCEDTIEWLDKKVNVFTDEDRFFLEMLRYGVQDKLNEEDPFRPRTDTIEFEAVLSEFYIHGPDFFLTHLSEIYEDKAEELYRYMRDEIFGGQEYDRFPLDKEKEKIEDELLLDGVIAYNTVVNEFITDSAKKEGLVPLLSGEKILLRELHEKGQFSVEKLGYEDENGIGEYLDISYKPDENLPETIRITRTMSKNGHVDEVSLSIPIEDPDQPIEELIEEIFRIPSDVQMEYKKYDIGFGIEESGTSIPYHSGLDDYYVTLIPNEKRIILLRSTYEE